jgi:hypothetical protein
MVSDRDALLLLLFIALVVTVTVSFKRWMLDALIEAIERFRGGGPPTRTHPSPAGDDDFLRKRRQ